MVYVFAVIALNTGKTVVQILTIVIPENNFLKIWVPEHVI